MLDSHQKRVLSRLSADLDKRAMAKLGSKLDNDRLSSVLTVGRVDEWQPSALVLVQAALACDIAAQLDHLQAVAAGAR